MIIKNEKIEKLAEDLAHLTGESKTTVILRALEERKERIARRGPSGRARLAQVLDFLEKEIWPSIPKRLLGRRVSKRERDRMLGYGRSGV